MSRNGDVYARLLQHLRSIPTEDLAGVLAKDRSITALRQAGFLADGAAAIEAFGAVGDAIGAVSEGVTAYQETGDPNTALWRGSVELLVGAASGYAGTVTAGVATAALIGVGVAGLPLVAGAIAAGVGASLIVQYGAVPAVEYWLGEGALDNPFDISPALDFFGLGSVQQTPPFAAKMATTTSLNIPSPSWSFDVDTGQYTSLRDTNPALWYRIAAQLGLDDTTAPVGIVANGDAQGIVQSDLLIGGTGNDVLDGRSGNDILAGLAGNDTLRGGNGNDDLLGDFGNDIADGGEGNDEVDGGDGNDQLAGGAGADILRGGAGSDILFIDADDVLISGGADFDLAFVVGAAGVTVNLAASEIEAVTGAAGNDILDGSASTDKVYLTGGGGADQLRGGSGNDEIYFDHLDTLVQGGAGTDFAWANGETVGVTVNMLAQQLEIVWGGNAGDVISAAGVAVPIQINGWAGNDVLIGGLANSILIGGEGADQIIGGGVADQLYFDHLDTVVVGADGFDYAFVNNSLGVTVHYATQSLESVFGGFFDDILDASTMTTTAYLLGNTGADQLRGGAGDDILWFDADDPFVLGGGGYDTAYAYNVGSTPVSVDLLAQGLETVWGGFGGDNLNATGMSSGVVLVGLGGADVLTGGNGNDVINAGEDGDLVRGGFGNDTIFGEGGVDIAVYELTADLYTWTQHGGGVVTVAGLGFVDTLYNVEFLRFMGGGPDVAI